jgi:uncharacterized cupredoxin-like copper-binding protein
MLGATATCLSLMVALNVGAALAQQQAQITLNEWSIQPASITVAAGERVQFRIMNTGERIHDLRIEGMGVTFEAVPGSDSIQPGQSAAVNFTFAQAGTYEMYCPVGQHRQAGMDGTFMVALGGAPGRAGGPALVAVAGGLGALGLGALAVSMALRRARS